MRWAWHFFLFRIKRFCDWQVYGQVLVPIHHCPVCGYPILHRQQVANDRHEMCALIRSAWTRTMVRWAKAKEGR